MWSPIVEMPKQCPKCHTPYWNKKRLERGTPGAVNQYGFDRIVLGQWVAFPFFYKDGKDDMEMNAKRARAMDQYIARKGWHCSHSTKMIDGQVMLMILRRK
jgi:hypothetical protein